MLSSEVIFFEKFTKVGEKFYNSFLTQSLYDEKNIREQTDTNFNSRIDVATGYINSHQQLTDYSEYNDISFQLESLKSFENNMSFAGVEENLYFFLKNWLIILQDSLYLYRIINGERVKYYKENYSLLTEEQLKKLFVEYTNIGIILYPFRTQGETLFELSNPNVSFDLENKTKYTNRLNLLINVLHSYMLKYNDVINNLHTNINVIENSVQDFNSKRNILENKIDQLIINPQAINNFKELAIYARENLDLFMLFQREVSNKLINKADIIQNQSSQTVYLSEEFYSFNDLYFERGHSYLISIDEFKNWTNLQKDDKVFQICYRIYLDKEIITLYEYSSYYNNKILH